MESCGMTVIKYILFVFNLIFAISGVGLILAGALVLADIGEYNHFVENRITAPPIILIVVGSIVFIVAFLGCFGAIRESHNLLIAFVVCLVVIFIIELAVGIVAAAYRNDFSDAMKETLKGSMKNYSEPMEKKAWDQLQKELRCCGVDDYNDWSPAMGYQGAFPASCCESDQMTCHPGNPSVYKVGCFGMLETRVKKVSSVLIGVGIGIAFIELGGIVLACCLAGAIRKEGTDK